jgi:MFS transporter, FHS family, L-fucose permease
VAGNPIMRDVSAEGKYSRNLSLAQFIKAIGSLTGPLIPAVAASVYGANWKIIFPIYAVALFITILSVATLKTGKALTQETKSPVSFRSCLALLSNPFVLMMVVAIFVYVGAEVCMSSGIPIYLKSEFGVDIEKLGLLGTGLFFTSLMIGRFLGGVVLNWISPKKFFITTVTISVLALLGLFTGDVIVVIASVVLVGLGFANIFPLVFSITVDALPEKTDELSGLMVTAIVGGAFLPLLMGFVADKSSPTGGFIVPLVALLYIGWTAVKSFRLVAASR